MSELTFNPATIQPPIDVPLLVIHFDNGTPVYTVAYYNEAGTFEAADSAQNYIDAQQGYSPPALDVAQWAQLPTLKRYVVMIPGRV